MDMMVVEAMWLRNLLGLPERDTWIGEKEASQTSDAGKIQTFTEIMGDIGFMLFTAVSLHHRCG